MIKVVNNVQCALAIVEYWQRSGLNCISCPPMRFFTAVVCSPLYFRASSRGLMQSPRMFILAFPRRWAIEI